jgi:hypothetical protein
VSNDKPSQVSKFSLYPPSPEEAIRHALNADQLPAPQVNGKHPNRANKKAKKRIKKSSVLIFAVISSLPCRVHNSEEYCPIHFLGLPSAEIVSNVNLGPDRISD